MPELGEVARVVHFANKYLAGHTIRRATAFDDVNVYGKAGCTAAEVQAALSGRKLVAARQQGKMFWFEMASPPHVLMHLGMAGWFHIRGVKTGYREAGVERGEDESAEPAEWPPRYAKFVIETDDGTEAAFVDFRRFGRIRLVNCDGAKMRKTSPLKENGPDPVQDKDRLSVGYLTELCARKKAPVKAVLLDQANFSGIGNWLGDEILYDARMHPSRTCNSLSRAEVKQLHTSIHYVCGLACEVLADSSKFPPHWLFKWRWGKGNSNAPKKLPNGDRIEHITVGSRTTAFVPSVQKMSGASTAKVKVEQEDAAKETKASSPKKTTPKKPTPKATTPKKATPKKRKQEEDEEEEDALDEKDGEDVKEEGKGDKKATPAKSKGASKAKQDSTTATSPAKARSPKKQKTTAKAETEVAVGASEAAAGRRRSGRLSRA